MSFHPLLSIVTINYNDEFGLKNTYKSIKNQINSDLEWILIDGGSTDNSKDFLVSVCKDFDYWHSKKDNGIYNAMNIGIKKSRGKFIWFVNSGDLLTSDAIKIVTTKLKFHNKSEKTKILLAGGYVRYCNLIDWYRAPREILKHSFHGIPALHQSTIYRRKYLPAGGYNEALDICSDHWMAAYFATKVCGSTLYIDKPISVHVIHRGAAFSNPKKLFIQSWKVQKLFFRKNSFKSFRSTLKRSISYFSAIIFNTNLIVNSKIFKKLLSKKVNYFNDNDPRC